MKKRAGMSREHSLVKDRDYSRMLGNIEQPSAVHYIGYRAGKALYPFPRDMLTPADGSHQHCLTP